MWYTKINVINTFFRAIIKPLLSDHLQFIKKHSSKNKTAKKHKQKRSTNSSSEKRINLKKPKLEALQTLEKVLPSHIVRFIETQINLYSKKSPKGHIYNSETKASALARTILVEKHTALSLSYSACLQSQPCWNGWEDYTTNLASLNQLLMPLKQK